MSSARCCAYTGFADARSGGGQQVLAKVLALQERTQTTLSRQETTEPERLQLATQVEALEAKLSAADQQIAVLEQNLRVRDAEQREATEHVVAAERELFVYRQVLADLPAFKAEVGASGCLCAVCPTIWLVV